MSRIHLAYRPYMTFSSNDDEEVFLCPSNVEKAFRLRSRIAQRLNVQKNVRLAFSLAAASPGSHFEHAHPHMLPMGIE